LAAAVPLLIALAVRTPPEAAGAKAVALQVSSTSMVCVVIAVSGLAGRVPL